MAEWQPRGSGAGGPAEDLVAETDPEQRYPAERVPGELNGSCEHSGVARAVGEDKAIRTSRFDFGPIGGVRQHDDAASSFTQRAEDIALDAVVHDCDRQAVAIGPAPGSQLGGQGVEPLDLRGARRLRHEILL